MSLETLIEAAEYIERNHIHFSNKNTEGNEEYLSQSSDINSAVGGHLKIDPNLPISFQFHTYSSSVPNNLVKNEEHKDQNARNRLNSGRISQKTGRIKSASFSVSNRAVYQQKTTNKRGRTSTCSETGSLSETTTRHRELHKTLEKNRRAHLRSCFEQLKQELPKTEYAEKKYSHINIIHYAIRYIHQLKKNELDHKEEIEKLSKTRTGYECTIKDLKKELVEEINNQSNQTNSFSSTDSNINKKSFSFKTQKDIEDLLIQVERSLLCESQHGSDLYQFSSVDQLDNSELDEYDDETTTTASECADDVNEVNYGSVSNSSILSKCEA